MNPRLSDIAHWLERLKAAAAAVDRPVRLMEVCGTHTMSAFRCGLHSLLPRNVLLLSGPGCPVCVTAQGEIDLMVELAQRPGLTLCTYGDMVRVPGQRGSLERARGEGADVRVVYSSLDAVALAAAQPQRQVVFAAVGFETTAPATAAALDRARRLNLDNFSVLSSHKRIVPAMLALLAGGRVNVDGFLCPGHVSVIIGARAYEPVVRDHAMPCVIGGFEEAHLIAALARLVELAAFEDPALVNQYPQAVTPEGNAHARALLERVFEPAEARWRGLGVIADSGLVLRGGYRAFDAMRRFGLSRPDDREVPGCVCGQVITGRVTPVQCPHFGRACTPISPLGPCMVSSEGTCQAWFKYGRQHRRHEPAGGRRIGTRREPKTAGTVSGQRGQR